MLGWTDIFLLNAAEDQYCNTEVGGCSGGLAEKLHLDCVYETRPKSPKSNTDTCAARS